MHNLPPKLINILTHDLYKINYLLNFTKYFDDILKVQPKSDLYKDIDSLRFLSGRPPFSPNQKITEDRIVEHKNTPVVKARVLDHFNKVLAEYDEEIKNSSNANQ